MKTNNSLKKQLEKEQELLNFIKLWLKVTWSTVAITWATAILLLVNFNISFLLTTSIIFTGGLTCSSIYMLIIRKKIKKKIKKLTHKIHIEEMTNYLNQETKRNNTKQPTKTNNQKNSYNYTPNNNYNYTPTNNQTTKNYKPKRKILRNHKKSS